MYRRRAQDWLRYLVYMAIDEICLQVAFILAVYIRYHIWAYTYPLYRTLGVTLILVDAVVMELHHFSLRGVVRRGYFAELIYTLRRCVFVFALATVYMFATQTGDSYSRISLFLTFVFHLLLGFGAQALSKYTLRKRGISDSKKSSMLVVASPDRVEEVLKRLEGDVLADYRIVGVVLTQKTDRESVAGCPVVADVDTASDYIVKNWIDSVYVDAPLTDERIVKLLDDCATMAVPTHCRMPYMSSSGLRRVTEDIGGTTVLTASVAFATPLQILLKRCFDIFTGLVGSLLALIVMAVVGPIIKKQSPGPVLFAQERVGRNGRRFKLLKIRSMHVDAEARKQELMDRNRIKDGMMFKLDFDPRIIGNRILPDGTKKTGIGEFIRRTSLDELPQFFLVLRGVMSTIGTRPPTVDEYSHYKYHHRARMAVKPGVTGMWQVSGRSDITDFEEVVKLDTEYISNWSPSLDLKILLKTFAVIFSGKGAL
ncbi:MAG: sugar transferase [Clostridiales bacterium]|nr:sugar transferase [Clostridiales bacterium]